jgi:integrase
VRQSAKRERIPDLLEVEEFQLLQAELRIRERILVWLDMTLGLRRGELAGLRWEDIHFEELTVMAQRSVVDQVVGKVKTEASKRLIPIDLSSRRTCCRGIEPRSTTDQRTTSSQPTRRGPARNVGSNRSGCRR